MSFTSDLGDGSHFNLYVKQNVVSHPKTMDLWIKNQLGVNSHIEIRPEISCELQILSTIHYKYVIFFDYLYQHVVAAYP